MNFVLVMVWPQPLDPLHSIGLSALAAAIPLIVVLVLMGGLLKSGLIASACGLGVAALLALLVWHMPPSLVVWSAGYGLIYSIWPILWIVFTALWLYNLTQDTGKFELLRRWMQEHASGNPCIQAILVAFSFGALMEGTAGFGAPVAVTACLLVGLGFEPRKAVVVALIANTAPVAFGGLGIPIVALAGVTGLNLLQLFALAQFLVSNMWGPYVTDVISASSSIAALILFLKVWSPKVKTELSASSTRLDKRSNALSMSQAFAAWLPWAMLSIVMMLWSYFKLLSLGQWSIPVPSLHNGVLITLYQKPYSALYVFQPLGPGTGVLVATALTALCFRVTPQVFWRSGAKALSQLRVPGLTVMVIVALAYLYNYSGMAFTMGAAVAHVGPVFPLLSAYLGWVACFLSGS